MTRFRLSPLGAAINFGLMFAVMAFWYWRRKKKARAIKRKTVPLTDDLGPSIDATKFTNRGQEAEQSVFRTGDGVYSHGEFAAGEIPGEE